MAYRLKTFRVQFVAEPESFPADSPCRSSEDVHRLARAIYDTLDADKEHFVLHAKQQESCQWFQGNIDGNANRVARPSA
jgi:hypothetical protein